MSGFSLNYRFSFMFSLLLCALNGAGQVTEVHYMMKLNEVTEFYDCYLIISKGSASTIQTRTQFSSQFSVVVPTGSQVNIVQFHMPLQNNQSYNGTTPCLWTLGSQVFHPAAQPLSDFYGITPSLTPACQYNNLNQGDTVKLFSLEVIVPQAMCKSQIRMFQNGVDPGAGAPGMGGGDFSNGFTIGNTIQRYQGNLPGYLPSDKVLNREDSGYGSLRKAIFCAKNNEHILVEDSLTGKTIQLLTSVPIEKNINILRHLGQEFTIKAPNNAPAFIIGQNKSLNISNIILTSGNNPSLAGRILVNNGTLSLHNVVFKDTTLPLTGTGSTINNKGLMILSGFVTLGQ